MIHYWMQKPTGYVVAPLGVLKDELAESKIGKMRSDE